MIAILFLIGAIAMIICNKYIAKKYYIFIAAIFFFGLLCLICSTMLYAKMVSNIISSHFGGMEAIFLNQCMHLSISDIQKVSLVGEVCILCCMVMAIFGFLKKKLTICILSAFFICIYCYMGLPDVMFGIYLKINSEDTKLAANTVRVLITMQTGKYAILLYFFSLPYLVCFCKYKKAVLLVTKKRVLSIAVVVMLLQASLLLLRCFNIVYDFSRVSYEILYAKGIPETYEISNYGVLFVFLGVISVCLGSIYGRMSRNYYTVSRINDVLKNHRLEKSMKMILHTYKNIFFTIRQLSNLDIYENELDQEDAEKISMIHHLAVKALYGLTKNIGMLDAIEENFERFKIQEPIMEAKSNIRCKENIKIDVLTTEEEIVSDKYYLSDAIYNMLSNAIEAIEQEENPMVQIAINYEDGWYSIEIQDNGCGIERKKLKEVFKPFISYKGGSENWGIGLYYSYKIIKALNGYLYVSSKIGEYTKFQIYLPQNVRKRHSYGKDKNTDMR